MRVNQKHMAHLLDHGFDTYWCVTEDGHHRLLRASELASAV